MNLKVIKTKILNGTVIPPSSKSQSIRGLIFALLAKGQSSLANVLNSEDTEHAMRVCQELGLSMFKEKNTLCLQSSGIPLKVNTDHLNTGNSGITTRFVMPMLGLRADTTTPITLNCGEQMRSRPIHSLVNALRDLGMSIDYLNTEGELPVLISGTLLGGRTEIAGLTSQYLSALLISLPSAEQDSEIIVKDLHERPYVEMTLNWLKNQNIQYKHFRFNNEDRYEITGNQRYSNFDISIPGDFSSASYLIATGVLIEGKIQIKGLDMTDSQGDKKLISILQQMGADISITEESLFIQGGKSLQGIKIDANDIPDLLPTLAVIGTYAAGKTEIINVKQARIKETDRIHSMVEGLSRLGAKIEEQEDGLIVYKSKLFGALLKGYDDHRTVMSLALAGMLAEGETFIDQAEAIKKTFPNFVELMQSLGANMKMVSDSEQ